MKEARQAGWVTEPSYSNSLIFGLALGGICCGGQSMDVLSVSSTMIDYPSSGEGTGSVLRGRDISFARDAEGKGSRYPITLTSPWTEQTKLIASDGDANDYFSWSVALSGDTAVIGAADKFDWQGQAYVYFRSGSAWSEQAKLVASDKARFDTFGNSVAISGDTIVVGAPGKSLGSKMFQGQVYVYVRSGTSWSEQAKLTASDGAADDHFGESVALSGDTIIIGSSFKNIGSTLHQGQAYVFVRSGSSWSEQAKLVASDGAQSDWFGYSVASSGDTAIVSAFRKGIGSNIDQGQVYVYLRSGASWTEQARLVSSDGASGDWFGWSVALDGNTALIGAYPKTIGTNTWQGQAYIFERSGTSWNEQAKLVGSDGASFDHFGTSVALHGDAAVIGAPQKAVGTEAVQGQAYVFVRSGGSWVEQTKLVSSDGDFNDGFGRSVGVNADTVVVGAPIKQIASEKIQGQAYVFNRTRDPNGTPCTIGVQCTSTFCVDGLCCDTACGGGARADCRSCIGAQTGGSDGVCGTIPRSAGHVCRPAADVCDKPELCDGANDSCPSDALYAAAERQQCRAATSCFPATYCDGRSTRCPLTLCVPAPF